jgi:hypothetical protein
MIYADLSWVERPSGERVMHIDDLPPELAAVIDNYDLRCIADDGYIDEGTLRHLDEHARIDLGIEDPESPEWVEAAIEANPGRWTARLCRAMHGHKEIIESIIHCGLCKCYTNSRRRARAAARPPLLPGFEEIGGAFQLHEHCGRRGLTWLRKLIYRLRGRGKVETRRERIPDLRQPRGWDWGTRIYPKKPSST